MASTGGGFIQTLSTRVTRILGLNPGTFTLTGTNTFLVGRGKNRMLIDSGAGRPGFVGLVKQALQQTGGVRLSGILLTHWHRDHCDGVPELQRAFGGNIPVHKVEGRYLPWLKYSNIKDRELYLVDDETTLQAYHTPGHSKDHACFMLIEEDAIFTGDAVNFDAGSPVLFEDLKQQTSSLERLLLLKPQRLFPAHGVAFIDNGLATLQQCANKMTDNERRILSLLSNGADLTSRQLTDRIYSTSEDALRIAAEGNVILHLLKLESENKVIRAPSTIKVKATSVDPSTFKGPGGLTMQQVHDLMRKSVSTDRQLKDVERPPPVQRDDAPPTSYESSFDERAACHAHLDQLTDLRWRASL